MKKKRKYLLDEEEQELLEFFEQNNQSPDLNTQQSEKADATLAAKNFLKKSERINIRMTKYDLNHIKRKAAQEGIPYQTLISSILHKYVAGYLP